MAARQFAVGDGDDLVGVVGQLVQGDLVIAPTAKNPRQRALVKEINLPKPAFVCREITEYDPEAGIPAVQPL